MEEIAAIKYLRDEELCFRKLSGGFLSLTIEEKTYPRVMVQRAFPLSEPTRYLSVREIREDREPGEEIGVIADLSELSEEKQRLICEELAMRYFTPDILKIHKLKDERGFLYLEADTTAGARKITAHNNSGSFIRLSKTRILIIDVDGNRYHIPDIRVLDKKSIRNLEVVV